MPTFDGLSRAAHHRICNEGEQPSYTTPGDSGMNLRAGPGTDYDKVTSVPAGTGVTALGTNERRQLGRRATTTASTAG